MAFLPSTKKYIEDYTNDDWKNSTYASYVNPTGVMGDFSGSNSITDMIPNYFQQEWYISSSNKYLYNSPLMSEMFAPANPPTLSPRNIPRCYVIAGIKKASKQNISIFLMIPAANSTKYYTSGGSVMTFYTPIDAAQPTSTTLGPLWTGTVHLNSDSDTWIYYDGSSYSSIRSLTKYKTITYSDGCIYDIFELDSYSRDSAPYTSYSILYQFPANSDRKWNESAFTVSHNGGTYYDAQAYIKVAYACRSASSKNWGTGANIGTLPSANFEIDDRGLGIRFYTTNGGYITPNVNTIYDIEKNYKLVSYSSGFNLPTAIQTTAKCGNDSSQATMYGGSNLESDNRDIYGSYKWSISTSWERYILPANALMGPLKFSVTYNVTLPVWNKHTNKDGTVIYDDTSYSVVNDYTYKFKVDMTNVPQFVTATGVRFRNHNAKYAVLANDFDYFEYTWRGVAYYAADPTIKLTLTYGDQVVVTKSGDGTATVPATFQHGPFLIAPTTQGQLVQVTGILTDARGRASEEKTFVITDNNSQTVLDYLRFYNYNYPTALVQAYRCLADGTPDDENGTYVKLTATWAFSQLDYGLTTYSEGTTDGNLVIRVRPHSGTLTQDTWNETLTVANGNKEVMLSVGLNQSLDIQVTVTDFIGNVFTASQEFIPSSQVVLDFRAGGEGLAIGKRNEFNKALEVAWDTTFYGNVNIKGNVNISGAAQTATTADAVTYYDTHSIGARTVQTAIDELATRSGVSTQQVQAIVDQAIRNLDVPTDDHINQLIITKINNIVFPPSISEARALELIADALKGYYTKEEVDKKIADKTVDLSNYYTKEEVDSKIAAIPAPDMSAYSTTVQVQKMIEDAINSIVNVNEVKF